MITHHRRDLLPLHPGEEEYINSKMFQEVGVFLGTILPVTVYKTTVAEGREIRFHLLTCEEWGALKDAVLGLPGLDAKHKMLSILNRMANTSQSDNKKL